MNKVSICIPTYGMKGKGAFYLNKNLSSIFLQTLQPHEVIVSDHSSKDDTLIEELCNHWIKYLNVKYLRNDYKVGCISANLNNCLKHVTGDIVDFMLQDDYYWQSSSLKRRVEILGDSKWCVTSTLHYSIDKDYFYWHLIPEYRHDIYLGFNSIGSPSLLTMQMNDVKFDEDLFLLTDCDYYKQLFDKFGAPKTSQDVTVISCIWDGQSQNSVTAENKQQEIEIVKKKFEK